MNSSISWRGTALASLSGCPPHTITSIYSLVVLLSVLVNQGMFGLVQQEVSNPVWCCPSQSGSSAKRASGIILTSVECRLTVVFLANNGWSLSRTPIVAEAQIIGHHFCIKSSCVSPYVLPRVPMIDAPLNCLNPPVWPNWYILSTARTLESN